MTVLFIMLAAATSVPSDAQSSLPVRLEAVQLMQQGRFAEAEPILTRLVARAPSASNTFLLGNCLLRRYDYARALAYLVAATDANPTRHQWLNTLAECHLEMGHCELAMAALDRAIAVSPLPTYHYNKAMCALNTGDLALAESELRLAVEGNPESTPALTKLGRMLADQGRDTEAEEHLSRSVELDGSQVEALFTLGQIENRLNRPEVATRRFREALKLYPTHAGALYNLGRTLIATGRVDEGAAVLARFTDLSAAEEMVQNYRDYLATVPTALPERLQLAEQLLTLGRFDEALGELEIARRLDPNLATTFDLIERVHDAAGNLPEAVRAGAQARALRGDRK